MLSGSGKSWERGQPSGSAAPQGPPPRIALQNSVKYHVLSRLLCPILLLLILGACRVDESEFQKLSGGWQYALGTGQDRLSVEEIQKLRFRPLANRLTLADLHERKEGIVYLKHEFQLARHLRNVPLALLAGRIIWADRTYLNGNMLGKTGSFGPVPTNAWTYDRFYAIRDKDIRPNETNELLIEIYTRAEGKLVDIPMIGSEEELREVYYFRKFYRVYLMAAISFGLMLFSISYFLIYWKRRKNVEYLYFALYLLFFALFNSNHFLLLLPGIPPIPYLIFQKAIWLCVYIGMFVGVHFVRIYLNRPKKKWQNRLIVPGFFLPSVIIVLIPDYHTFLEIRAYPHLSVFIFLGLYIYWTVSAWRDGIPEAKQLAMSMGLVSLPIIYDIIILMLGLDTRIFMSSYTFPIFLYSVAVTVATKFATTQNQLQISNESLAELNVSLEDKVLKRTDELNNTLTEVQKLKAKQDGDYFLTSMLIEPFQVNELNSQTVQVEFLAQQFKTFRYQKYTADLGGDLCACHTIKLKGKTMTLFLSADAMGKSMQGAGGAIVLGSVFGAIITRTRNQQRESNKHPEEWLQDAFREIHTVFRSFKGSMMISLVLGLVDDETGLMYYINADYPFPVSVYRDEISFMDDQVNFHKAGTQGEKYQGQIQSYQMRSGETIIFGSDGKDDLEVPAPNGERFINGDENLFLSVVREAGLSLPGIRAELERRGEFIDDLSILSLAFRR